MSTPYTRIYNKFLSKVNDDEWSNPDDLELYEEDWAEFLSTAMGMFKFPRFRLLTIETEDGPAIIDDLTDEEVNILATLMKKEWLDRNIMTWDQIKTLYDERDFSQANMIRQLINAHDAVVKEDYRLQKIYSRSILGKDGIKTPFDYRQFGGS